jgi:recombination protein RecA
MSNTVVDKLLTEMQAKFGADSIMRASQVPVHSPITSGSLALDFATGVGGLPSDRVIEVAGDEGSGKTTLGLLTMMHFLDNDHRIALIIDTEHKLTMEWVQYLIGAERMERVLYMQPDYMESATNMYIDAVSSGQVGFVLFDSIGGSPTKAAVEKEAEKVQVGGNAGAVTKFARIASTLSAKNRCLTFCVNQVRADMEGFRRHMTPGGHGLKHACVMRIKLRRSTQDKVEAVVNGEKMVVGFKVFASVIKNQMAAQGRTAWWWFYNVETPEYGFGIDTLDEVVRLAVATKVITQAGSWYSHPALPEYKTSGEHKVQGIKGLGEAIAKDYSIKASIVSETMAVLKTDASVASEVAPFDPSAVEEDLNS